METKLEVTEILKRYSQDIDHEITRALEQWTQNHSARHFRTPHQGVVRNSDHHWQF